MRALNTLSDGPNYRKEFFTAGLRAAGADVVASLQDPRPGDVLLVWNRHGSKNALAQHFERAGAKVLVCENGYLGKVWQGKKWFALALGHHAGAGEWNPGGPERWDSWGAEMEPWRDGGTETIVLAQRGIGEPGIASPEHWAERTRNRVGGRIRVHPGANQPTVTLQDDLKNASCVVTWHSGAALLALLMGVPVFYGFPQWIGAGAGRPIEEFERGPRCDDAARLAMFQRLAWAQWTDEEVRNGDPFKHLLG